MRGLALASLLIALMFGLGGCASTEAQDPDRVSNIPWAKPERWEGQGPLGGFAPGGGY